MYDRRNRAAQYVRMSTDMQTYSIANQLATIAQFASKHGLSIVRTFEDAGRSGLQLDGRPALQSLIDYVRSGRADFETILVYDVSRWGRFQDSDESAYYEFLCKTAGVRVEYCAEHFRNDGSVGSTILKSLKRVMAGEFSRELSVKVFAGQSRIVANGYRIGSRPGFGLRRMLLDERGDHQHILNDGQQKAIKTHRTILVPGPIVELRLIERVFDLFIDQKYSMSKIAETLNVEKTLNAYGRPWNQASIHNLLSNPKYVGDSVYNRRSKKLGSGSHGNPEREWVVGREAYESVVKRDRFNEAKRLIKHNPRFHSQNQLLDQLTALWCVHGRLHVDLLKASPFSPSINTFQRHFRGLSRAYRQVGYRRLRTHATGLDIRGWVQDSLIEKVKAIGAGARVLRDRRHIRVNEEVDVAVTVARKLPSADRWRTSYISRHKPDVLVVARLDGDSAIIDFFILPFLFLLNGTSWEISSTNFKILDEFRTSALENFAIRFKRHSIGAF